MIATVILCMLKLHYAGHLLTVNFGVAHAFQNLSETD